MYLTKQQILEAQDRPTKDVEVPEWGGVVRVGTMSGKQRDQYEQLFVRIREGEVDASMRASLCAVCIVDENGKTIFTKEDLEALGEKSGRALGRVFNAATELNVLNDKKAEEIKGN